MLRPVSEVADRETSQRSLQWTVSSGRRISGRALELGNVHESFLALSDRCALSIFDATREPWSTVRMEQRGGILCLLRSKLESSMALMSASVRMRQKRVRVRSAKDVVSWPRKLVVS